MKNIYMRRLSWLFGAILLAAPISSQAACDDLVKLDSFQSKKIWLRDDTLLFKVSDLQMDIDGYPSAYGVRDQGVENVCNGLSARVPASCEGKAAQGHCYAACQTAFADWNKAGAVLDRMTDYMCSTGLGGGSCSSPVLVVQEGDRKDWFVSETSVKTFDGAGKVTSDDLKVQAAQLDPVTVPYFVIPGKFRSAPWDATPGELGVIFSPKGTMVKFVIGDTGGALDEVSAKLFAALYGQDKPPTYTQKSALGEPVTRFAEPKQVLGEYRVAIFRHSGEYKEFKKANGDNILSPRILNRRGDALLKWIDTATEDRLKHFGGADKIKECTN